jgi:hypothetical protein
VPWSLGDEAHIQRHSLAASHLHLRRKRAVTLLADFDAMRPLGELYDEAFVAFGAVPSFTVDSDLSRARLNAED